MYGVWITPKHSLKALSDSTRLELRPLPGCDWVFGKVRGQRENRRSLLCKRSPAHFGANQITYDVTVTFLQN